MPAVLEGRLEGRLKGALKAPLRWSSGEFWRVLEGSGGSGNFWRVVDSFGGLWSLAAVSFLCFYVFPLWLSGLLVLKFARRRGLDPQTPPRIYEISGFPDAGFSETSKKGQGRGLRGP